MAKRRWTFRYREELCPGFGKMGDPGRFEVAYNTGLPRWAGAAGNPVNNGQVVKLELGAQRAALKVGADCSREDEDVPRRAAEPS